MAFSRESAWAARFVALTALCLLAAHLRLLPHLPNMTPVAALALFGGVYLESARAAFALPLAAMLLSDSLLEMTTGEGYHSLMPFVYGSFALIAALGLFLRERFGVLSLLAAVLASVGLFFLITNFGVWLMSGLYPPTAAGLLACYAAALPFLKNQLVGDLLYSALLFGGWESAKRLFPALAR